MLLEFEGKKPVIHQDAFVENTAQIIGEVQIGKDSTIWFYTVIRGDINSIQIGEKTNIQDLTLIHVTSKFLAKIGSKVTVGHRVVLHGCNIQDRCLVGMGSVVLDNAEVGPDCLVAAGSLITPGFKSTPGTLIMGSPAKTVRELKEEEIKLIQTWENYVQYGQRYKKGIKIL